MQIDFSKGVALHRLYGHTTFMREAKVAGKDKRFAAAVCQRTKCNGKEPTEREILNLNRI